MSKRITLQSDIDELIAYVYGTKAELSPALIEKLERLQRCAEITRKYGSRLKVIPQMVKEFSRKGPYSAKTAQADFDDCQELFGVTTQTSKMFWFDIVLGMMMETRNNAYIKRSYNTASIIEARMLAAVKDFIGDGNAYPIEKLQPQDIQVGFFPELLNVPMPDNLEDQLKKLTQAKKRKDMMLEDEAEDAKVMPDESA